MKGAVCDEAAILKDSAMRLDRSIPRGESASDMRSPRPTRCGVILFDRRGRGVLFQEGNIGCLSKEHAHGESSS